MAIKFQLLKKKKNLERLDITPFILVYAYISYLFFSIDEDDEVYLKLALIGVIFLNCIAYLLGFWSSRMKALIQYSTISRVNLQKTINDATHVLVAYTPKQRATAYEIVKIQKESEILQKYKINLPFNSPTDTDYQHYIYFVHFMEKKFILNMEKKDFERVKSRVNFTKLEFISKFELQSTKHFDKNSLEIPVKSFKDLLRDQLMEPFSFFQIFSVSLQMMDSNFIYPVITLFLLFITACTVVIQRIKTLVMLRQMRLNPQYIHVYREDKWIKIGSQDLFPGDICAIIPSHNLKAVEGIVRETDEEFLKKEIPFSHKLPMKLFMTENLNVNSFKTLPCDFLLISGNCVVNESILTGESIPQIKDSIEKVHDGDVIDLKQAHKTSVLFCGTDVLQVFPAKNLPAFIKTPPPGNGCVARVLRTGYDTSKGKLIRTVLFNNENLQIKQTDAFALIFVLLVFSIISSGYVLANGLEDGDRNKNKLFLRCILIITTVVPPELPMILSIAVNSSLLYLQKKRIFCTEPYRIPFGGKVSTLAFDKTGTLTSDNLLFKGIVEECSNKNQESLVKNRSEISKNTQSVLAGCQSLIFQDKKLIGDPIELLFFENQTDWEYQSHDKTAKHKKHQSLLKIYNLFPFKSDLKRMSTVAYFNDGNQVKDIRALVKGAPETIKQLLVTVPEYYDETYKFFTKKGYRVLALSYKTLNPDKDYEDVEREELECDLIFCGFYICTSPLKNDTAEEIKKLQKSEFKIIMITGDNLLTAISVGQQLNLGAKNNPNQDYFSLEYLEKENKYVWIDKDENISEIKNVNNKGVQGNDVKQKSKKSMICATGPTLKKLFKDFKGKELSQILQPISIYARTSPQQKELIVLSLKENGVGIIMCGDGTNDVGALKKSDIGIALVGTKEETEDDRKAQKEKKRKLKEEFAKDPRKAYQQQQQNMKNMSLFDDQVNFKQGDACIAAPFTSKHSASIKCVSILLRQGIATLVQTVQTYKILCLQSILLAYSLSALHLVALKFSETQQIILGLSGAFSYFQFQNNKPRKQISNVRPSGTIFEIYWIISCIGQAALHLYGTEVSVRIGKQYSSAEDLKITHDQEFKPTFLNTSVFLFSLLSQTTIFMFNYGGEPHIPGLTKNAKYFKFLVASILFCIIFSLNLMPEFNATFDLTIPNTDNSELGILCLATTLLNYALEFVLKYLKYKTVYDWV